MGTWGPGNFEDDDALDTLSFWREEIERSIDAALGRSEFPLDGLVIQRVMADISILLALAERCSGEVPRRLDEWQKKVLETYDGFPQSTDENFRKKRRDVIAETFARFMVLRRG